MKNKSLGESLSESHASFFRLGVGSVIADNAVAGENSTVVFAGFLPIAHPFAAAPAIRAEESDLLSVQFAFAVTEHRCKFRILKLLAAH